MRRRLIMLLAVLAVVFTMGCTKRGMGIVADVAYKFNPIAGAAVEVFNLLAQTFVDIPEDSLGDRQEYNACAFSARPINEWKTVAEPTGVERVPQAVQTLWFQSASGAAMMQVLCVPLKVTMEQWGQGTLNNLPPRFDGFKLLGQGSMTFKNTPAHWLAYNGAPKGFTQVQRGYLLLVHRGEMGLIVSIAVPDAQYDQHAPTFRAAVDSIELN